MLSTKLDFYENSSARKSWFDIIMIALYGVVDTIGRWLASFWVPFNDNTVIYYTLCKIIHIPLVILIQLAIPPNWLF